MVDDDFYGEERTVDEATLSFVAFRLGQEWYGCPVSAVREVIHVPAIVQLPSAPPSVIGLINLRGNIVPVVDLKSLFSLAPASVTEHSRLILVKEGGRETALLADEAAEIVHCPVSQLEAPLATLSPSSATFVESLCPIGGRLFAIVRLEKIVEAAMQTNGMIREVL